MTDCVGGRTHIIIIQSSYMSCVVCRLHLKILTLGEAFLFQELMVYISLFLLFLSYAVIVVFNK